MCSKGDPFEIKGTLITQEIPMALALSETRQGPNIFIMPIHKVNIIVNKSVKDGMGSLPQELKGP